jgi:predicted secreted hydrolase
MVHRIRLFVGHPRVLSRYQAVAAAASLYYLTRGAVLATLPVDDDLLDALHSAYGSGDWLDTLSLAITTGDMAFAQTASRDGALAYLETDYHGGDGSQSAVLWQGGDTALKPIVMTSAAAGNRPRSTWPINAALRGLGVKVVQGFDEFDSFGLGAYRSHADIAASALQVRLP